MFTKRNSIKSGTSTLPSSTCETDRVVVTGKCLGQRRDIRLSEHSVKRYEWTITIPVRQLQQATTVRTGVEPYLVSNSTQSGSAGWRLVNYTHAVMNYTSSERTVDALISRTRKHSASSSAEMSPEPSTSSACSSATIVLIIEQQGGHLTRV